MNKNINQPKVSVLIPTYNRSAYLAEAINSVLIQSFTDFEIVVVDNCSTDETSLLIGSYQDKRLKFVRNESNIGAVGNYNKALRLATGQYIYLFSDDDLMSDEHNLQLKVNILDKYPSVGVVHSDIKTIDATGKIIAENWAYTNKSWDKVINNPLLSSGEVYQILYNDWNFVNMPTALLRKSIIADYKLEFNNQLKYLIDWNIWLQMSLFCDFYYIDKPLVSYRRHSTNESSLMDMNHFFNELVLLKIGLITLFSGNEMANRYSLDGIVESVNKQLNKSSSIIGGKAYVKSILYKVIDKFKF
jgi:glycosyltransferase involved in cell wall biosynthesis